MNKKLRTPIAPILLVLTVLFRFFQTTPLWLDLFDHRSSLTFLTILVILAELALAFVLFTKKRDSILVIALGANAFLKLIHLVTYFSLTNLLTFAAYGLLAAYALVLCEQTLFKLEVSQFKQWAEKLFFLPAILCLLGAVVNLFSMATNMGYIFFGSVMINLLSIVTLLVLAMWLKDPYQKEAAATPAAGGAPAAREADGEGYCGLGKHIVLCLFTFGIWALIWTYRTTGFLNRAPGAQQYNPTTKLLLCMFVPFYQIYWFYKHGQRIDAICKEKNLGGGDMATICLLLGIFIPLVAMILMQDRINAIATKAN